MPDDLLRKKILEFKTASGAGVDGFVRDQITETRIDTICRNVLGSEQGQEMMDYLKSITTNVVLHPTASDQELRMLEGARRIVGILDRRTKSITKGN